MILIVIAPILSLGMNVLTYILVYRRFPFLGMLKALLLGFSSGMILVILLSSLVGSTPSLLSGGQIGILLTNVIIYTLLGYSFFHFNNLGETARRIRILWELYDSPKGLTQKEIVTKYSSRGLVEIRLKRFINSGQVVFHNGRYYLGKPFLLLSAKMITLMKQLILRKKSEFS